MNTIKGKIKVIGEVKEYGSNGFTKREFVLTTEEKYPQEVKLELYKDDCGLIEDYNVGDSLEATFNIKGNEYKGNYYVNLQAWKLASSSSFTFSDRSSSILVLEKSSASRFLFFSSASVICCFNDMFT